MPYQCKRNQTEGSGYMSIPFTRPARAASLVRVGLLIGVDAGVLIALRPDWPALGRHLTRVDAWIDQVGTDQAVASIAGAALWLCAAWLAVGLSAIVLAAGPGLSGRAGRQLARLIVPATIQRAVGGLLGLSLVLGLAAPLAAPATAMAIGPAAPAGPAPGSSTPRSAPPGATIVPSWPMSPPPPTSATPSAPATPAVAPVGPAAPTAPAAPVTPPPPAAPVQSSGRHVVAAGDSLWQLAAAQLTDPTSARTSTQVARWYGANRVVIGGDPALIRPGQILLVPPIESTGPTIGTAP
jgi:hypothetical protein